MSNKLQRILSLVLVFVMFLTSMPTNALATGIADGVDVVYTDSANGDPVDTTSADGASTAEGESSAENTVVAKLNGNEYTSLKAAFEAALVSGGTIVLQEDVQERVQLSVSGTELEKVQKVTLHLNGHTWDCGNGSRLNAMDLTIEGPGVIGTSYDDRQVDGSSVDVLFFGGHKKLPSKLTVKGGTFNAELRVNNMAPSDAEIDLLLKTKSAEKVNVTEAFIEGGEFKAAVHVQAEAYLTINGGSVSKVIAEDPATVVDNRENKVSTVTTGKISAVKGILSKSGITTTITAVDDTEVAFKVAANGLNASAIRITYPGGAEKMLADVDRYENGAAEFIYDFRNTDATVLYYKIDWTNDGTNDVLVEVKRNLETKASITFKTWGGESTTIKYPGYSGNPATESLQGLVDWYFLCNDANEKAMAHVGIYYCDDAPVLTVYAKDLGHDTAVLGNADSQSKYKPSKTMTWTVKAAEGVTLDPDNFIMASGYALTENEDGTWTAATPAAVDHVVDLSKGSYTIADDGEWIVLPYTGSNTLTIKADATVELQGVNIAAAEGQSAISIESGNVTLNVTADSTVMGDKGGAGVYVAEDAAVTIKGGKLTAIGNGGEDTADSGAAGIGGTYANGNSGAITIDRATVVAEGYGVHGSGIGSGSGKVVGEIKIINGANVYAVGGYYADGAGTLLQSSYGKSDPEGSAAIGGGGKTSSIIANITIENSTVTAYGGSKAAGIGANSWSSVSAITISGNSNVTAQGGSGSAGIGSSRVDGVTYSSGAGGTIEIKGGVVIATGGAYGAGIGGGYNADSAGNKAEASGLPVTTIIISSGDVTATGGEGGAGIGGGYKYDNVDIDITGGTVTAQAGAFVSGKTVDNGGEACVIGSGANGSGVFENSPAVEIGDAATVNVTTEYGGKPAIEGMTDAAADALENVVVKISNAPVAQVGEGENAKLYTSLQEAINACTNGETVTLIADITYGSDDIRAAIGGATGFGKYYNPSIIYVGGTKGVTEAENQPSNVNVTIDLNGHTVTSDADAYMFLFMDNCKVTMMDSVGGGKVVNNSTSYPAIWAVGSDTLVTIQSGTYQTASAYGLIHATHSGDLVIEGGLFKTTASDASLLLMINSQKYNNPNYFLSGVATLTVYGGTFVGFNPAYVGDDYGASSIEEIKFVDCCELGFAPEVDEYGNYTVKEWNLEIDSLEDLQRFAKMSQSGNSFSGKTVKLVADIDFEGANFLEIEEDGTVVVDYRIPKFNGTFDGQGHTIKNFNFIVKDSGAHNIMMFSQDNMWAYIKNVNIENVTVEIADISGQTRVTALANRVNAGGMTSAAIENVHIKNYKIVSNNTTSDDFRIGGFAYFVQGSQLVIKDSSITGFEVDVNKATLVAGAVAVVKSKCDFENVDVKDAVFNVGSFNNSGVIGGFAAQTQDQGTGTTFTGCDVSVKMILDNCKNKVGGFVGSIGSVSQFYNCTVTGSIKTTNDDNVSIGGFVGDLGWNGMYTPNVQHEFKNCVADVDITAESADVGGFIGDSTVSGYPKRFMPAYFTNCSAKGDVKTTNGVAGGFVGCGDRGSYIGCSASGNVTGRIAGGFWGEIYPKQEAESTGGWSYQNKEVTHTDPDAKSIVVKNNTATGVVSGTEYQAGLIGFMKDIYVNADNALGYATPVVLLGNQPSDYNRYPYPEGTTGPAVAVAAIGTTEYLSLSEAIDTAQNGDVITLLADIAEDVTVTQQPNVVITIDGDNKTYTGTITVNGKSAAYETAALTIKNVKFVATADLVISLGVSGDNNTRYTSNVTVQNCTFTGEGNTAAAIKSHTGGDKNLTVIDCTATGMHSLIQVKNVAGVTITGCTITGKNGISVGASSNVVISKCIIEATGYGIRADGIETSDGICTASVTVADSTIEAELPIVVRNVTANGFQLNAAGNTLNATNTDGYQIIFTNGDDGTFVAPTGTYELTIGEKDAYNVYPDALYVAQVGDQGYMTLREAVKAANDIEGDATVTLLKDVELGEKLTISGNVTIEGAYTITRADSYTGTLFTVNAGATLTLDGGLVIDGGNEWTYVEVDGQKKFIYEAENYVEGKGYDSLAEFVTAEPDAPVATADMIAVSGTLVLNSVTIQNQWGKDGANVVDLAGGASLTMNSGAVITHNITNGQGPAVYMSTDSHFTMNGGAIAWNGGRHHGGGAVSNHGGYMVMEGGSISNNFSVNGMGVAIFIYDTRAHDKIKNPNFTMNGGTISSNVCLPGTSANANGTAIYARNGIMEMNGGSISDNYGRNFAGVGVGSVALTITGGSIVNNQNLKGNTDTTNHDLIGANDTKITGGEFTQDVSAWVAPGYALTYNEETNTFSVTNKVWEMHLTGPDGEAHWLSPISSDSLADVLNASKIWYDSLQGTYTFTLKLMGKTKTNEVGVVDFPLTIDLNGYALTGVNNVYPVIRVQNGAKVTVKNGTITNDDYVFVLGASDGSSAGYLTIESGSYTGETTVASVTKGELTITGGEFAVKESEYGSTYLLNCVDANYNDGTAKIVVTGGTFKGFNPANNAAEGANTNFCAEGYIAEEKQTGYFTVRKANYVAQVGDVKYESLTDAIAAAQPGDEIVFLADITEDVTVDKNVTIDGAKFSYTGTITIAGDVDVTIKYVNFFKGYIVQNGSKTIATLTITDCSFANGGYAVTTERIKNLTIERVNVTGQSLLYAKLATSNIVVKDVTITGGNYVAHLVYGSTAIFENVTATKMTAYGICTQNYGAKTITLKNCNFEASPNYYALAVRDDRTTAADTFIFEGENAMSSLYASEYANYVLADKTSTLTAPEGANVTTDVADHKVVYENGMYKVVEKVYVAQVGDVKYEDLNEAIAAAAATEEKVVTVLKTIELTEDGTLDLQGVRLNASADIQNAPVFRVLAKVTVINGGIVDGRGPVAGEGGINCYAFIVGNDETAGELTITGGTYRGVTSAISITNGVVNISGGTFQTGHDNEGTDYGATYLLNCVDAAYKNGTAKFNITGGRFIGFNPENNAAEGEGTNFLSDNYKASDYYDNDNWYVAEANVVLDGDKYFATIKDALATLSSADTTVHTVKVLKDLDIDVNYSTYNYPILVNGFCIELDLNGKTITADWSKYTGSRVDNALIGVCNGGKLDVIDSVGGGKIVNNDNKANVENRIFWIMTSTANKSLVVNIKGGSFIQNDANTALLYVQGNKPSDNLAPMYVNITGGYFETVNDDFFNAYDGFQHESYITGGSFNKNPTDWEIKIHPDYKPVEGENGIWSVVAKAYVAQLGETKYESLQEAIDACVAGDNTITLLADIAEDVTIKQVEGVNVTIDGAEKAYSGTITIHGSARYTGEETLTIQNVKFETSEAGHYFIDSNSTGSAERYAHNVTVKNSTFTATGDAVNSAAAMRIRQGFDIAIEDVTATGMHSLFQGYGCAGVTVTDVEVTGKNGISVGTSTNVQVTNATITATGYGIRADGTGAFDMTVTGGKITADMPIVVRNTTGAYQLSVSEAALTGNNENGYQIIFTNGDDGEYKEPTGAFVLTGGESYRVYPTSAYVAKIGEKNYFSLTDAIKAAQSGDTITFIADITEDVTVDKNVTIDGAGKTYTGKMTLTNRADITIKNVNFDGKGYNGYAVEARGAYYITIEDCTAKNYGYGFVQLASGTVQTTVKNVTVSDMNYGVKIDYSNAVVLENVDITAAVAAVLNSTYGVKTVTIKNSKLNILGTWQRNETTKTNYVFEGANTVGEFKTVAALDTFKLADVNSTLTAPEGQVVTTDVEGYEVVYEDGTYKLSQVFQCGTWGGIDWKLYVAGDEKGTLIISPTKGEPTTDNSGKWTYEVGQWPEAVIYKSNGSADAIGGWPYDRSKVTTLIIEEGVTSIGSFTAQGFTNLTGEVVIPSTVTYIGQEAFQKSTFTKLTFAKGGTEELCIAQGAFKNLIIEEVALPDDRPVHLHAWVFNNCHNLKHAYLPATLVSVHGTNHVDYFHSPDSHSNPTWTKSSEIFAYDENLETITFGSEAVRDMFFAYSNGTDKDYIVAYTGLVAYNKLASAIEAAQDDAVVLLKNNAEDVQLSKSIELVLNGKTYTGTVTITEASATLKAVEGLNVQTSLEGHSVMYEDGVYFVMDPVACIGETYYANLVDAINAAQSGETINVIKSHTIDGSKTVVTSNFGYDTIVAIDGKAITIDFGGNTVSMTPAAPDADGGIADTLESVIFIENGGSLTLKGEGGLKVNTGTALYALIYNCGSTLVIEGGNYNVAETITAGSLLYADGSHNSTVSGGNFTLGNASADASTTKPWIFNTEGKNKTFFTVTGGTYNQNLLMNYGTAKDCEVSIPEDKALKNNGNGTWTVVTAIKVNVIFADQTMVYGNALPEFTYTTNFTEDGMMLIVETPEVTLVEGVKEYEITANASVFMNNGQYVVTVTPGTLTVLDAVAKDSSDVYYATLQEPVSLGKNFVLLRDVELTEPLVFDAKGAYMKLNGYNLSGDLDTLIHITADGTVSISGGGATKITNTGDVIFMEKGTANIYGEVEIVSQNSNCIYTRGGSIAVQKATLTANGDYPAIQGNGNYAGNVSLYDTNVTKASVTSNDIAIYWPNNGALTIKGGVITGKTAVYAKSGTISIQGGTFYGTGSADEFVANNNGAYATGDAVVIEYSSNPAYETPVVSITGGTFVSENAQPIAAYGDGAKHFVSGGFFNKKLDYSVVVETKAQQLLENGYWTIAEGCVTVTSVDGDVTYYVSLSDAVDAAKAGETVTLLKDIEIAAIQKITKAITLDLATYTISRKSDAQGTVLNINDTSVVVKNGKLSNKAATSGNATVIVANGELKLENVEIVNSYSPGYALTAQRATHVVMTGCSAKGIIRSEASDGKIAKVEITSGMFYNASGNTGIGMETVNSTAVISLTGGTYDYDPAVYCAEGYYAQYNGNGTWTVKPEIVVTFDNVTMVEGNKLPEEFTWTSNFAEVSEDGEMLVVEKPEIVVDGAGEYEITANAYVFMCDKYVVTVVPGKLTVQKAVASITVGETTTNYATLAKAIEAAQAGETIELIANVTEDVTVGKSVTIDGANFNYTGNISVEGSATAVTVKNVKFVGGAGYAITTNRITSITVENCTVEGYGFGFLYANKSTVTVVVKNVTVDGGNYGMHWVYGTSATLENVTMTDVANGLYIQNYASKTITVKSSNISSIAIWERDGYSGVQTFKFEGANTVGTLTDSQYAKYVLNATNATLTAPEGYTVTTSVADHKVVYEDGMYKVVAKVYVAQVGETKYESIQEAVDAAQTGETVTVIANHEIACDVNPLITVAGKAITIDLNGKTITANVKESGNEIRVVFQTEADAKLTIVDSVGNGTANANGEGVLYYMFRNAGTTTVAGGTYNLSAYNGGAMFFSTNSNMTVTGGNFNQTTTGWMFNTAGNGDYVITVSGGTYNRYFIGGADVTPEENTKGEVALADGKALIAIGDNLWKVVDEIPVTVTINPVEMTIGHALPEFTYTVDVVDAPVNVTYKVLDAEGNLIETTGEDLQAGTYTITADVVAEAPYAVTVVDGTLTVKKFVLAGANVVAGDSLRMNFYVKKSDLNGEGYYVVITKKFADGRDDVTKTIELDDWTDYSDSMYRFGFSDISAKEMSDLIYVTVYNSNDVAVSEEWTDSLRIYAKRMIERNNAKLTTAMVDMLNYGAAAQKFFGYDNGNLANADIDAYQQYATASVTIADYREKGDNYIGSTVSAKERMLLTFVFTNITQDMTATFTYTDHYGNAETVTVEGNKFEQQGSLYGVSVTGLAVADGRQLVTCEVKDASGNVVAWAKDSIESYCARQADLADVFEYLMKFVDSAKAYFSN